MRPMRLPIRSEPDAFRLAFAFAFVAGVSLLLGYLIAPIAGIALFALIALGALVWGVRSEEPGLSPLRAAEQAGHGQGADNERRILVVASEAPAGDELGIPVTRVVVDRD